jgi:hypothetical protein
VQRALGDHEFGLIGGYRCGPERLVQHGRHQRGPARPADEEQSGHGPRVDAGLPAERLSHRDRRAQDRTGQQLELFAAERHLLAERRHGDDRRRGAGQHFLAGAHLVPDLPAVGAVGPQAAVRRLQKGDDRGVDIQPADIVQPVGGDRVEAVRCSAQERDVTGAGTQIVDEHGRADRQRGRLTVGEVRGRRDGFADQLGGPETGLLGGLGEQAAPAGTPTGRVGQHQLTGATANLSSLGRDPFEHGGEQVTNTYFGRTQQDGALVDAPLRVGLQPLGVAAREVGGVPAGVQPSVGSKQHGRREQRRAVEQQRADPAVGLLEHRHGGGGPEVHPESIRRGHGGRWYPTPARSRSTATTSSRGRDGTGWNAG